MMSIFKRIFWRKRGLGWRPNPADQRDQKYAARRTDLPAAVSLEKWAKVVDQKSTSSCVGNAIAGAVYIAEQRSKHGSDYGYPSRMFLYWMARNRHDKPPLTDDGTYIRGAFKALRTEGVCDESHWPFKVSRVNDQPRGYAPYAHADPRKDGEYLSIAGGGSTRIDRIKSALADGYAVVFGTDLAKSFMSAAGSHVIDRPGSSDKIVGGHAMVIVGYMTYGDETLFRVLNSWGTRWRDGGMCWFTERYITWVKTGDFTIVRGWNRLK